MIKDYSNKRYLKGMQNENRNFLQNTGGIIKKWAPYLIGGALVTTFLVGGINYASRYESENIKKEFSQLDQKLEHEREFNETLFREGGQLSSK